MMDADKISTKITNKNQLPYQIAEYLAEKIIHMEIKPGERIFEAKIAEELGVSRSPVREALHILNEKFLVELLPRRGAVVAGFSIKFIDDLYDVLQVLYTLLIYKGSSEVTEENINQIMPFFKTMEECADKSDFEGYYHAMFGFVALGMKIVGNPILERLVLNLWPSKRRMEYATLYRRKDSLRSNLDFFLNSISPFIDGRLDTVKKNLGDYIRQEKENAKLLATEFDLNKAG
jgi:DNA-binding GntR family transcriptional regulator